MRNKKKKNRNLLRQQFLLSARDACRAWMIKSGKVCTVRLELWTHQYYSGELLSTFFKHIFSRLVILWESLLFVQFLRTLRINLSMSYNFICFLRTYTPIHTRTKRHYARFRKEERICTYHEIIISTKSYNKRENQSCFY